MTWVYVIGAVENAERIVEATAGTGCTLVFVPCADWNRDLTPWQANSAFPGCEAFGGGACVYLRKLLDTIIPDAEEGFKPARRYIAGYSLAGLFSLWTLYQTDRFHGAASMSGSLWYDDFVSYVQTHTFPCLPDRIVFSVGGREKNTKNTRIQTVERCTRDVFAHYRSIGIETSFTLYPGGHFANVPYRIADGIRRLIQKNRDD